MPKTFVVECVPGPAWVAGNTSREQPYWTEHAAFMDALFADGTVVLGGPIADYSSLLIIVAAEAAADVTARFEADPFVVHAVVRVQSVREWLIFLDARQQR